MYIASLSGFQFRLRPLHLRVVDMERDLMLISFPLLLIFQGGGAVHTATKEKSLSWSSCLSMCCIENSSIQGNLFRMLNFVLCSEDCLLNLATPVGFPCSGNHSLALQSVGLCSSVKASVCVLYTTEQASVCLDVDRCEEQ